MRLGFISAHSCWSATFPLSAKPPPPPAFWRRSFPRPWTRVLLPQALVKHIATTHSVRHLEFVRHV
jgi:hypothetical protein